MPIHIASVLLRPSMSPAIMPRFDIPPEAPDIESPPPPRPPPASAASIAIPEFELLSGGITRVTARYRLGSRHAIRVDSNNPRKVQRQRNSRFSQRSQSLSF